MLAVLNLLLAFVQPRVQKPKCVVIILITQGERAVNPPIHEAAKSK